MFPHLFKLPLGGYSGAYDKGFSDPNVESGQEFASNYRKAKEIWEKKVICYYRGRNRIGEICPQPDKDQAYYWLGRVAHLLEDLTVPAHVQIVRHDPFPGPIIMGGKEPFESFVQSVFLQYHGADYQGEGPGHGEYRYEDLPGINLQQGFRWRDITIDPTYNLFKLFWYTAQKTQYFATGGSTLGQRNGEGAYVKLNGDVKSFQPSLWEVEGKVPVQNPQDIPSKLQEMASSLIPHAFRAVAGLYRFFWQETHPGLCNGQFASISNIPLGFGSPLNVVLNTSESLMNVFCSPSTFIELGNSSSNLYIYKKGYIAENGAWRQIYLSGPDSEYTDWYVGTATTTLPLTSIGNNYIVAYMCTWTGDQWKCGCLTSACDATANPKTGGMWQLQTFQGAGGQT